MRYPEDSPQFFHEAVKDFLNALDVSVDRLAPFAGLNPQQLRRLGVDGIHHTLNPTAIDNLVMASVLVGKPLPPEVKDAWEKRLKVCSLYTLLIATAHRRTKSVWPKEKKDYQEVWETAVHLALYSQHSWYYENRDSPPNPERHLFYRDSQTIFKHWKENRVETEEDIATTLSQSDQGGANKKG